ncbi:hypothetical protein NDU88_007408 [Pleurodeles waltl]|uniref:Uncharacterized protein n=1 Tax=Pleurodeles waltl TaxID=8319 RepID=A0AAV7SSF0_PLEWA|nr:hypothetical protein NDU88_007408 [Pleurodeles waltl]
MDGLCCRILLGSREVAFLVATRGPGMRLGFQWSQRRTVDGLQESPVHPPPQEKDAQEVGPKTPRGSADMTIGGILPTEGSGI